MSKLSKSLSDKTSFSKAVADDIRLSYTATGVLNFLLTRPDGWEVSVGSLVRGDAGAAEVKAACAELLAHGYMTRHEGARGAKTTHVSDVPYNDWIIRNTEKKFSDPVNTHRGVRNDDAITETDTLMSDDEDTTVGAARRIMRAWVEATDRDPNRTKLSGARFRKVEARLREGFSEEELTQAVQGIALSGWHCGDNPENRRYDDMELALRNGQNVEKFRDLYLAGGEGPVDVVDKALGVLDELGIGDW